MTCGQSMQAPDGPASSLVRTLLILGRISNLPTVWSNGLAAWWLGGGGPWGRLVLIWLGTSLLYTGGMFLNDAFDVEFDRRYRPERPIPSGSIRRAAVWALAAGWLLLGWLALAALGTVTLMFGSLLAVAIIVYNAIHKRTALSPLLISACRFLVYLIAASATLDGIRGVVVVWALILAAYVTGLSYFARYESRPGVLSYWPGILLFVPATPGILLHFDSPVILALCLTQGVWVMWCAWGRSPNGTSDHETRKTHVRSGIRHECAAQPKADDGRFHERFCFRVLRVFRGPVCAFQGGSTRAKPNIAGLLAGIALVDWLAAAGTAPLGLSAAFAAFFLMALLLQRVAPAT